MNSSATQLSLWRRLRYTPMHDWLHGRLSAALDYRLTIANAQLPEPIATLILHTVRRSRLWRQEKVDVARELCAHFADALDAGQTAEQTIASFGNPRSAAKLIRRAKKRNRGIIWKMWMRSWQAIAVLVGLYALAALVLALDKPLVTVDYVAKLTAQSEAAPPDDQAWPLYRQALLSMQQYTDPPPLDIEPDDPRWPQVKAYLQRHAGDLAIIRRAAQKPVLRPIVGPERFRNREDALALFGPDYANNPDYAKTQTSGNTDAELLYHNSMLDMYTLYQQLGVMRHMARLLKSDVDLAIEEDDIERALDNVGALYGMAQQLRTGITISEQLVGLSIGYWATQRVDAMLHERADQLNNEQLVNLTHHIASLDDWQTLQLEGMQWGFEDLIQRCYGRSGRMTLTGMAVYGSVIGNTPAKLDDFMHSLIRKTDYQPVLSPINATLLASRHDMLTMHRELMGLLMQDQQRSLREKYLGGSGLERQCDQLNHLRYSLILPMRGLASGIRSVELARTARRATMIAIAAELYRRDTGSYPADIQTLVPRYLPQAYPDESATSGTLLLKVIDGQLTVYGRGIDDDDDGGAPPKDYHWPALNRDQTDGDWVLYPAPQDD